MGGNVIRSSVVLSAAILVAACGSDVDQKSTSTTKANTSTAESSRLSPSPSTASSSPKMSHLPAYGVVETTKRAVAAGEQTCAPPPPPAQSMAATTGAPGAPTVVVAVPDGFSQGAPPSGDVALNLTGPDGLAGVVRITPTSADAAAAFQQYADARTAGHEFNSVSLLSGELCNYSGQKLMGTLGDGPGSNSDYVDRIVHVWTNNGNYLIALQLQGPAGSPGLDAAKSVFLGDFGIQLG